MKEDDFDNIPLEEAQDRWISELDFRNITPLRSVQEIPAEKSTGRVTANPVLARIPAPSYYSAVCDGISVKSSDTQTACSENPLRLKIGREAYFVETGSAIPNGFDAILSINEVKLQSLEEIVLENPVTPWINVRPIGEDMNTSEVIIGENRIITPFDIGALIAGGVQQVTVRKRPRVGILPIGTNQIASGTPPQIGKSIDFRSPFLYQLVDANFGDAEIMSFIPEKIEDIKELFKIGLAKYDLLLVICGPSWGTRIIKKLFIDIGELIIGSVNINPGGSICLGIYDGKPIIGLPEYPVSIYLAFEMFIKPLIFKMLRIETKPLTRINCKLGRSIESKKGIDEFFRINIGIVNDNTVALPIYRGDAVIMSLVKADGILRIPAECETISAGEELSVEILPHAKDIKKNILMTGTYDICIDILKTHIERKVPGIALHSANIGSLEGLKILKTGLAHISGIHAFDEKTGTYNIPLVQEILDGMPLVLINLFNRRIGLLVRKENPKQINTIEDLTKPGVVFINRQKDSGTRIIFEHNLKMSGIKEENITMYNSEAKTHITLASIIASGLADAGFGILPAAKAFKLDFIPLFSETFDIIIPKQFLNSFIAQVILEIITSSEFRNEVSLMGGYDMTNTGTITYEQGEYS